MALALSVLLGAPGTAVAQGTGRIMDISTSIRSAGMGGASAGVFWGDTDPWGNAAVLAFTEGLRYSHGRTQLVPGLATDVFLTSSRFDAGYGGFGLSAFGRPLDQFGGVDLSYGTWDQTDAGGNIIGTFTGSEAVRGFGVGVAVTRLIDTASGLLGQSLGLSRFGDLAVGVQRKHVGVRLAPVGLGGTGGTDTYDWGTQLRVSPLSPGWPRGNNYLGFDVSLGRSVLNAQDAAIRVPLDGTFAPVSRVVRRGGALRAYVRNPLVRKSGAVREPVEWLLLGLDPLLSFGWAADREEFSTAERSPRPGYDVERRGIEATVANIVTIRAGHVTDRDGDIDGDTFGWGFTLPVAGIFTARYDWARIPQARSSGLPDVTRRGWSVALDAGGLLRVIRASRPG